MAAHVCFRLCGWHAFHQMKRSAVNYVPQTGIFSSAAAHTSLSSVATSLSSKCRLYHVFSRANPSKFRNSRKPSLFQRGFRSRQEKDNCEVEHPFGSSPGGGELGLLRPFMFTVFVCGSSFAGAMVWQYETLRSKAQEVMKGLERSMGKLFEGAQMQKEIGIREHLNAMWNDFTDGQKMVAGIIFCNFLVFLAWKNPNFHPLLMRYFANMPGNPTSSMLLSSFSHFNLWHIAANMYVLWSFASVSLNLFGREQWLAVYLSAATISSLASMTNKVLRRLPGTPSLGASGAIMCLLGAVCVTHPDARLSIAFVGELYPHSFSANSALKFIVAMDAVGLLLGWRVFDHAAHLGGILFGIWYATYGHKMIWGHREVIMKRWHELRGKPE